MNLLRRIACLFLGHQPGHGLYHYAYGGQSAERKQWPGRQYAIAPCGYECARCGAKVMVS